MTATVPARPAALPVLRPLTTADVLDGGFRLVRAAPVAVGVPALVVAVISTVAREGVDLALAPDRTQGLRINGGGAVSVQSPGFLLTALINGIDLVVSLVATGVVAAFVTAVAMASLAGRPTSLASTWPVVRRRLGAVVALAVVVALVETLALLFLAVPGILLWVFWALAVPALVAEDVNPFRALRRSRQLVRGSFWRVFGLRLLMALIVGLVANLVGVPFSLLGGLLGSTDTSVAAAALDALGTLVAAALTLPVRAGVDVVLYLDQRVRREAFDLTLALAAGDRRAQRERR